MTQESPPARRRVKLYTARASAYDGPDAINIMAIGGSPEGARFAPPPGLVQPMLVARKKARAYVAAPTSREFQARWAEYSAAYLGYMHRARMADPEPFAALLGQELVTLVCACPVVTYCHRGLLAGMLAELGADYQGERNPYGGERD